MPFHLVGYFPKLTAVPAGWQYSERVSELCSVSTCLAHAPDGWIDRWLHNELGLFNSVQDARSVLPPSSSGFSVFAYRLLDQRFGDGVAETLIIPPVPVETLPATFTSLGFDIVTKGLSDFFECSPLSCNGMAAEAPVNSYCLIDSAEVAMSLAAQYSRGGGVEPGYCHVIEVLRSQASGPSAGA